MVVVVVVVVVQIVYFADKAFIGSITVLVRSRWKEEQMLQKKPAAGWSEKIGHDRMLMVGKISHLVTPILGGLAAGSQGPPTD